MRRKEVRLPSASLALSFVESVMDKAIKVVKKKEREANEFTMDECFLIRDAAMFGTAIGHVGLTVRISAVRDAKAPVFAHGPCHKKGCTVPGCKGNRIFKKMTLARNEDGEVAEGGEPKERYVLEQPHHKTSRQGISMPPVPIYSGKLECLLDVYTAKVRTKIIHDAQAKKPNYKDPKTLFVTRDGKAWVALSKWYRDLHIRHMAPYPLISLNAYRSVFVSDRMKDAGTHGDTPSNEGFAIIMGNSMNMWNKTYWKNKRIDLANKAAAELAKYREEQLAKRQRVV